MVFKEKRKKKRNEQKENPTSDWKPKKDKEQDNLKKTSLGPLRQGQRLDTSEKKQCSSKEHKPPKHTRAHPSHMHTPLNKCQHWAQTCQDCSQNRSDRFHQNRSGRLPKSVRPIWYSRPHPPKAINAKEMHKLPFACWDKF
jgi:hypothetical protein